MAVDGTASVGVGLPVDASTGALSGDEAGTGSLLKPIATRVASEPTAETGRTTLFGNGGAVGWSSRDCPNPVSHSARATQRVTGQNHIATTPIAIPTQSHLRLAG
jgi:ribosomal protein L28